MRNLFCLVFSIVFFNSYGQPPINPAEKYGDTITVSGRIYAANYLIHVKTKPTFLNVYDSSPSHRLMLRIDSGDRQKFAIMPEKYYLNKNITIKGLVENYKGTPLIKISDPSMIKVDNEEVDSVVLKNAVFNNTSIAPPPTFQSGPVASIKVDTALQSQWVTEVSKQNQEQEFADVNIVLKEMPLRLNPNNDAPLIAELKPGITISVLSTSKRWSYVAVKKPDGSGAVYGYIKNKMRKHLKSVKR